jgi:alpha-L-rhamnosidase
MFNLPLPKRIWRPWDQPAARMGFKTSFLVQNAAVARLHLAVSGPYLCWLDGVSQTTPNLPFPSWRVMHAITLELAFGVHHLYIEAEPGEHGQPFLLACLDWQEEGHPMRVASDSSWLMVADPPENWVKNPSQLTWRPAWAFDGVWSEPWGMPSNAPDDFCRLNTGLQVMTRSHLQQVASLFQGHVPLGTSISVVEGGSIKIQPPHPFPPGPPLLENRRPRLEWYKTREAHSQINNNWLDLFEARAPHVVFDAGGEVFARLRVQVRQGGPAILAVTTGESPGEVQRYQRRVTDIFSLKDGEAFTTAPTGFRYAKLMALSSGSDEVTLEPVELQSIQYPVEQAGKFNCSDQSIDAIWQRSARTAHLCMQTEIWDGIKRDQLPWMGDLYTEALAIYHAFGEFRLARRTLAVLAEIGPSPNRPLEKRIYPGLHALWKAPSSTPYGPQSGDINGIPAYTMWWLVGVADYVRYSGDTNLVEELAVEIQATLDHIASWVDDDGTWRLRGGWDFIDWAPVPAQERAVYCHLLASRAMRLGARLLEYAHLSGEPFEQLYQRMAEAARRAWWQNGRGTFGMSHHVNSAAISSGILTRKEAGLLFEKTLAEDPPLSMTYWHRFLDLNAAAETGNVTWGLNCLRRYWGQLGNLGSSTLWEAFDPFWVGEDAHSVSMVGAEYARYGGYETSLCHGWSAGPAAWLHTAILGVQPSEIGYTQVVFNPCLGDLAWAQGTIPTPHGPIQVFLKHDEDGQKLAEITCPSGIEIKIPSQVSKDWQISHSSSSR